MGAVFQSKTIMYRWPYGEEAVSEAQWRHGSDEPATVHHGTVVRIVDVAVGRVVALRQRCRDDRVCGLGRRTGEQAQACDDK